ncbi:copper resistance protein [[Pantoea] beijingensis]|uniref:Copper resistance protein n=1 Tax=[Pantoea] beijingensis TaxID=1324864 RepID=A0A443I9H2_9GAMM|nr:MULTISPECIES: copper resistance protein [Erwiniaceae]RWR00607.1 copper resistance protein [[Pantoea] beijingensis]
MEKRRRIAKWFLTLACLVILVCMAQRVASLHALQMKLSENATLAADKSDNSGAPVTPCELSAKSLLAAAPLIFETAFFGLGLLLAVLALIRAIPLHFPPTHEFSSPVLRIHLRNCVFRE